MTDAYRQGFMDKMAEHGMAKSAKEGRKDRSFRNVLTELLGPTVAVGASTAAGALTGKALAPVIAKALKMKPTRVLGELALANNGRLRRLPGKLISPDEKIVEALTGLGFAGGVGANIGGFVSPLFTKRRTKKEQYEHDSTGNALKNLLIPGYGNYNLMKRVGRVIGNASEG